LSRQLGAWGAAANAVAIRKETFQSYFPDGMMQTDSILGIPKSYYVYRKAV
jgi:hypothetical protein